MKPPTNNRQRFLHFPITEQ